MKIGITIGDPSGIGPEVTLKALQSLKTINEVRPQEVQPQAVVIGAQSIIDETIERFGIQWDGEVINCSELKRVDVGYGKLSALAGRAAYSFILKGYELINDKKIDALVTAPICKASLNLAGFNFPGHTELLANLSNTKRFAMMLCGDEIRVTLVTTHIQLKRVPEVLTKEQIVEKIELTYEFLSTRFNIHSPKIGICALNPHGGEGIFGNEEALIIKPAIDDAKKKGILVDGPYAADTLFTRTDFDAIIAMYHDQGLIPIKLKEFGHAVNVTIGLPFVRTSPDHGTAFDIAGKGIANPESMIRAIKLAVRLAQLKPERLAEGRT
ncbi:MAG: 4-hydroxythreonine-4-phosphate dehydrogenase PdxA [bacterium]|nr:4-hydroxythreonine-4-phosphate dehydrogenase PdxA [bacterium]